jgi:hypothetical protein
VERASSVEQPDGRAGWWSSFVYVFWLLYANQMLSGMRSRLGDDLAHCVQYVPSIIIITCRFCSNVMTLQSYLLYMQSAGLGSSRHVFEASVRREPSCKRTQGCD